MTIVEKLEDFSALVGDEPLKLISQETLEDHRLAAFEAGYSAGWDDATAAKSDENKKLLENLRSGLQDAEFTYSEALAEVSANLGPFFEALSQQILPEILKNTVGHRLVQALEATVMDQINKPLSLFVSAADELALRQALQDISIVSPNVIMDPSLESGQLQFRTQKGDGALDINTWDDVLALMSGIPMSVQANEV